MKLNEAVIQRGIEDLAVSTTATQTAQFYAKSALANQHELQAKMAVEGAEASHSKLTSLFSEGRAQETLVRMYAQRARMYANHAAKVAFASRHLAEEAAEKAFQATKGWIANDAKQAAEAKAAFQSANFASYKTDRIAAAVAAAAEPCHLTLLRTQKFCAETYSKAKSTQDSMKELMVKARKVALTAQQLQNGGLGLDAQATMTFAHGIMQEAEVMRQHGLILYKQANEACSGAGYYQGCEQQAAASAAASLIIDAPMTLPKT